MTLAAVDRLVHHATIFEMNVESYRRRSAMINRRLSAAASCNRQHISPSPTLKKRREKPMPKLLKTDMRITWSDDGK
jgi:hypothetical protein